MNKEPSYIKTKRSGRLPEIIGQLDGMLSDCRLCPRRCGANRKKGGKGRCRSGYAPVVSSHNLHFGEEPPVSGARGSGTIFFANCNLGCCFCQNYPISQLANGNEVSAEQLAGMMTGLQDAGAHNINLVTPTHYVPQIIRALDTAIERGLSIPLVYNSGGYDSVETLQLLDGIVDIYMPDAKYSDGKNSGKYSDAADYPEANRAALKEMQRQVGSLVIDAEGIAVRGLLVRHLVLPCGIAGSGEILGFIAGELSKDTYMSIMAQYHPAYRIPRTGPLSRRLYPEEYREVLDAAEALGLERGWHQEL